MRNSFFRDFFYGVLGVCENTVLCTFFLFAILYTHLGAIREETEQVFSIPLCDRSVLVLPPLKGNYEEGSDPYHLGTLRLSCQKQSWLKIDLAIDPSSCDLNECVQQAVQNHLSHPLLRLEQIYYHAQLPQYYLLFWKEHQPWGDDCTAQVFFQVNQNILIMTSFCNSQEQNLLYVMREILYRSQALTLPKSSLNLVN